MLEQQEFFTGQESSGIRGDTPVLRILGTVIAIFSTATLLTLSLVLAYTWGQGNLTDESGKEILAILKGEPRPSELNREDECRSRPE